MKHTSIYRYSTARRKDRWQNGFPDHAKAHKRLPGDWNNSMATQAPKYLLGCSSAPGIVMMTEQQLLDLQRQNEAGEMKLAKCGWQNVERGKLWVANCSGTQFIWNPYIHHHYTKVGMNGGWMSYSWWQTDWFIWVSRSTMKNLRKVSEELLSRQFPFSNLIYLFLKVDRHIMKFRDVVRRS